MGVLKTFAKLSGKHLHRSLFIIIIITFIFIQEIGFTKSLLNWKTFTGPNSTQLPFLYAISQTLETVNVELELDYLHLLKWNSGTDFEFCKICKNTFLIGYTQTAASEI